MYSILTLGLLLILFDLFIVVPALGYVNRKRSRFRDVGRPVRLKHWIMIMRGFLKRYWKILSDYFNDPKAYQCDYRQQWLLLFDLRGWYLLIGIAGRVTVIELLLLKWRYRLFPKSFPEKERTFFEAVENINFLLKND
ncbi:MAG: hypothetical protein ACE5FU_14805 [Nitrospinota bacterium]